MISHSRLLIALFTITLIFALRVAGAAQESSGQDTTRKPRPSRSDQKPADETVVKDDAENALETTDQAMRRVMVRLSDQIGLLTNEVKRLRKETERNSQTMELLLLEERLARVESKLEDAQDQKYQFDAQELDIQRRQQNIQQEVMLRGGLRRDEAERAIRAEFQRALENIHKQQEFYEQRIAELQAEAERLRLRVQTLRLKLEPPDEPKEPSQQQD